MLKKWSRLINKGPRYKKNFSKRDFICKKRKIALITLQNALLQKRLSKSLGTGISKGIKFNEIEVFNNKYGKPQIRILGDSLKIVKYN